MGIGVGIFLIALGAILTFAVNWHVHGLNLHAVGWVLMLAGVAGIALYFVFWNRRRPQTVVQQGYQAQGTARPIATTYEEPVYRDAPPPPGI
jgi:Domain of unknown function (DUF6458)